MKIKAMGPRVVVKPADIADETKFGLLIPASAKRTDSITEGSVLDIGDEVEAELSVGDRIAYTKYSGSEVKIDEERFVIVEESDILAVLE